ncbi:uncharacterized protein LOC142337261 [Convolutriloba macropyga]|uniref:uncharacterized protein LOC142337261 n=1 Tax=Convolutriloba macropyga TaxID=536237 RepID=UPI003F51ED19
MIEHYGYIYGLVLSHDPNDANEDFTVHNFDPSIYTLIINTTSNDFQQMQVTWVQPLVFDAAVITVVFTPTMGVSLDKQMVNGGTPEVVAQFTVNDNMTVVDQPYTVYVQAVTSDRMSQSATKTLSWTYVYSNPVFTIQNVAIGSTYDMDWYFDPQLQPLYTQYIAIEFDITGIHRYYHEQTNRRKVDGYYQYVVNGYNPKTSLDVPSYASETDVAFIIVVTMSDMYFYSTMVYPWAS